MIGCTKSSSLSAAGFLGMMYYPFRFISGFASSEAKPSELSEQDIFVYKNPSCCKQGFAVDLPLEFLRNKLNRLVLRMFFDGCSLIRAQEKTGADA